MNIETTIATATPAAATPAVVATPALLPTKLTEGQIVCGKIAKLLDYGVTVLIDGERALLKDDQFSGGSNGNRRANRKAAKVGDEIAVEVVSIRPPAADDKSKVKSNRIKVSARSIQDATVLGALVQTSATAEGTALTGKVKEVRKDFALVELTDGPAAGYLAILHAINVPGADRKARDRFVESLQVGETITGECLHCVKANEPHVDLRIGITLTAEAARSTKAALEDTTKVYKGQAGRSVDGGIEVVFGPSDAPMTGILPNGEVPAATKAGGSVRVRIASVNGNRIVLTRRGV